MKDSRTPLNLRGNSTIGWEARMSLEHPWFLGYPKDNFGILWQSWTTLAGVVKIWSKWARDQNAKLLSGEKSLAPICEPFSCLNPIFGFDGLYLKTARRMENHIHQIHFTKSSVICSATFLRQLSLCEFVYEPCTL